MSELLVIASLDARLVTAGIALALSFAIRGVSNALIRQIRKEGFLAAEPRLVECLSAREALLDPAHKRYLTYREHDQIRDAVAEVLRHTEDPSLQSMRALAARLQKLRKRAVLLDGNANRYNSDFLEREWNRLGGFFSGEEDGSPYGFHKEQIEAILRDDWHNQVIAGAGSGKTSVIAGKVAYLVRYRNVLSDRVLLLAYNRDAATEMKERLLERYGLKIAAMTFHKLGRSIVSDFEGGPPPLAFSDERRARPGRAADDKHISRTGKQSYFQEVVETLLIDDPDFRCQYALLRQASITELNQEADEAADKGRITEMLLKQAPRYYTYAGEVVRSMAEVEIANFLLVHGIAYEYEKLLPLPPGDQSREVYRPDFTLIVDGITIEHWGIDRDGAVPSWFEPKRDMSAKDAYKAKMRFARELHERIGRGLIETYHYEWKEGRLLQGLERQLKAHGVVLQPLSDSELREAILARVRLKDDLIEKFVSFVTMMKCNALTAPDVLLRLETGTFTERQKAFARCSVRVYEAYQQCLARDGCIDFEDMINRAADHLQKHGRSWANHYDYVLVDEFQDISHARLRLVKSLLAHNADAKLLCVGDDWQSIYRFTGSSVEVFLQYGQHFERPCLSRLMMNFRSAPTVVELGNHLMRANKSKSDRVCVAARRTKPLLPVLVFSQDEKADVRRALDAVLRSDGNADCLILARYNRTLQAHETLVKKHKKVRCMTIHKSKGLEADYVFLVGLVEGISRGFPARPSDNSLIEPALIGDKEDPVEEERRLLYVAITRARKRLFVFTLPGQESRFVREIQPDCLVLRKGWNSRAAEASERCPECGSGLVERVSATGKFLGCSNFQGKESGSCRYTRSLC